MGVFPGTFQIRLSVSFHHRSMLVYSSIADVVLCEQLTASLNKTFKEGRNKRNEGDGADRSQEKD